MYKTASRFHNRHPLPAEPSIDVSTAAGTFWDARLWRQPSYRDLLSDHRRAHELAPRSKVRYRGHGSWSDAHGNALSIDEVLHFFWQDLATLNIWMDRIDRSRAARRRPRRRKAVART